MSFFCSTFACVFQLHRIYNWSNIKINVDATATNIAIEREGNKSTLVPEVSKLSAEKSSKYSCSGIRVDVIDLSYNVIIKGKEKHLLQNVNLSIEPGDMVALMGPSGAGKSTLLDVIADRKLNGNWSGNIFINRSYRTPTFQRETAYVLQDDMHMATLTVEETIFYAAWCRMSEGTNHEKIIERVDFLLEMMGLEHIRKSIVGDAMHKGISGGQMKRLSIAVEIVALPELIFLDEPTSGLDSSISLEVMAALENLSHQKRTIMSTIHQPSPKVFGLFNKVVLMVTGRLVFFGPTDRATEFFGRLELGYVYDPNKNAAEFIIDVCGGKILPANKDQPYHPEQIQIVYENSEYYSPPVVEIQPATRSRARFSSSWTQLKMLLHRGWLAQSRDIYLFVALIMKNMIVGIVAGVLYIGQGDVSEPFFIRGIGVPTSSFSNCNAVLFLTASFMVLSNTAAIPSLISNISFTMREMSAGAYGPVPNWITVCVMPVLPQFVAHWFFVIPAYFLLGFPPYAENFFYFSFNLFFLSQVAYYLAMMTAAATRNEKAALGLFPLAFLFNSTFSGFAININSIPKFWTFGPYVSFVRWSYQGLMINRYNAFATDDSSTFDTGYGDPLGYFAFDGMSKNWSFLILAAYIAFNMFMCLLLIQPPKKKIVKVSDASSNASAQEQVRAVEDLEADVSTSVHQSVSQPPPAAGESEPVRKQAWVPNGKTLGSNIAKKTVPRPRNLSYSLVRSEVAGASISGKNPSFNTDIDAGPEWKPEIALTVDYYKSKAAAVADARGCRLVFRNLSYSVPNTKVRGTELVLLKDANGLVSPGEMCALMGSSGAGKSTLLDVLAGRKTVGSISGDILFNGSPRSPAIMKSVAYVMQDNVHIGTLSVRQTLYYAAELRLSERTARTEKDERITEVLQMLGLEHVADTVVGDKNVRGLSGGQVKRLSIGVEIISFPDLMFLDEPTTGLDSAMSLEVIAAVRNLANQNRTVICTIHSPSLETGSLFDKLLLMSAGRVIYFGPAVDVAAFFSNSPYRFYCSPGTNPFDFAVAVAGSFVLARGDKKIPGSDLADYYAGGEAAKTLLASLAEIISVDMTKNAESQARSGSKHATFDLPYSTSILNQILTLCRRSFTVLKQSKGLVISTIMRYIIVATFYGSIFLNLSDGTDSTAYFSRMSIFFFSLMFLIMTHQSSIPGMITNRLLFYRERGANAYGALPYWVSTWVTQVPLVFSSTLGFSLVLYWMVGFRAGAFGYFFYFTFAISLCGLFYCQFLAAVSRSSQMALTITPLFLMIIILFAGFIVAIPAFPAWLAYWGPYISFMRWAYQGLILNEFDGNKDLPLGSQYISMQGFQDQSKEDCAAILFGFIVGMCLSVLMALKYINFEKR